ncbi:type II secretion system protein M [Massilia kyonggiensis]|nr:type II secretion system protein M [Massilia kyonggiensis]
MKRRWLQFTARVEALQPRERIMAFGAAVVVLVFLANALVFSPLSRKEAALRSTLQQQTITLGGIAADIEGKARAYGNDPNEALRKRLGEVRAETARTSDELRTMQKGLVPPERIAPLLESILRANGRLKLVSLKTLPVTTLTDGAAPAPAAPAPAPANGTPAAPPPVVAKSPDLLYRHGVELTVRGSYLDMVDYMQALETLPTQLFWGKAQLEADEYPNVRLTLTLYTLSLDPKWMKL